LAQKKMTQNTPSNSTPSPDARLARQWMIYLALFLVIFAVLDYSYYLTRGTALEHLLIDTLTVRPAVAVINVLVPAAAARASGHTLSSPFGRINILQGCEGTEGMFLLIAAVLPFPARWKWKLVGAVGGMLLMYAMNQLRILVFVVSLRWHRDWFSSLHGLIAPTFIVLAGCMFFFVWANAAAPRAHA
jgi:exosortase family protein XrtM